MAASTRLTETAAEQGTYVVTFAFYDEAGDPVTPTAITWTLTDPLGNVINDLADVEVDPPAAEIDIVLSGLALALEGYATLERHLTVEATYNSTLGSGLPLKAVAILEIEPLVAV